MEYHQLMKAEGLESKGYDIALLCKFDGFILGLENYLLDLLIDLNAALDVMQGGEITQQAHVTAVNGRCIEILCFLIRIFGKAVVVFAILVTEIAEFVYPRFPSFCLYYIRKAGISQMCDKVTGSSP